MKIKILSSLLILCGLSFYSCSNDDEVFSCDPNANEWVKENLVEVRSMSRSNWLAMGDEVLQRAVYSAFTPEQKRLFWKEKLGKTLSLPWSDEEKEHILKLIHYINTNTKMFEGDLTDADEIFIYKWVADAKDELNWSTYLIGAIVMAGQEIINVEGETSHVNLPVNRLKSGKESETCECNTQSSFCHSIFDDPYSPSRLCEKKRTCDNKSSGCGWFMQEACIGMCEKTGL